MIKLCYRFNIAFVAIVVAVELVAATIHGNQKIIVVEASSASPSTFWWFSRKTASPFPSSSSRSPIWNLDPFRSNGNTILRKEQEEQLNRLNPRAQRFVASQISQYQAEEKEHVTEEKERQRQREQRHFLALKQSLERKCCTSQQDQQHQHKTQYTRGTAAWQHRSQVTYLPRGGQDATTLVHVIGRITDVLVQCGTFVLPPTVAAVRTIVLFYRALPKDVIIAQVGLVYCFLGGYYPTLFSSLQAAQQCGWNVAVSAVGGLVDEALNVIEVLDEHRSRNNRKINRSIMETTGIVMATVDPIKINQAASALYTTWLGVSVVLEREYARVITLSLTLADYLERIAQLIFAPPARLVVPEKYHLWIPVVIGWLCKGAAMNVAWRIQRVMTAATSAVTGGLLFARACRRMLTRTVRRSKIRNRDVRDFDSDDEDDSHDNYDYYDQNGKRKDLVPVDDKSVWDEVVGFFVCGVGFYTQIETQRKNAFSFRVPFPLSLITWPFDWAEKWIQWQITKR